MALRLAWIQVRLFALLALGMLLEPRLLFAVLYLPFICGVLYWYAGAMYLKQVLLFYVVLFAFGLYRGLRAGGSQVAADLPLVTPVPATGGWRRLWDRVGADMKLDMPEQVTWVLTPLPWRHHGCDAAALRDAGQIVIPLGCVGGWTMLDAACHVAYMRVRPRPLALLRGAVEWTLHTIANELYQAAGRNDTSRRVQITHWYGQRLGSLAATWDLIADMDADRRLAQVYGVEAVSRWITESQLAYHTVPDCVRTAVQTAEARGLLIPIAASCKAYQERFAAAWQEAVTTETNAVGKGDTQFTTGHAPFRLLALSNVESPAAAVFDPRLLTTLVEDLDRLEERVVRHELGWSDQRTLVHVETSAVGELIVLPQLREDLTRNAALLDGRTWRELPELAGRVAQLAEEYKADARYLFGPQQRAALVPQLLAAFFAMEMEKAGWKVSYSFEEGLAVSNGDRRLLPADLLESLRSGDLSAQEFVAKVEG